MRREKIARLIELSTDQKLTVGRHNRAVIQWLDTDGLKQEAQALREAGLNRRARPAAITPDERQQSERSGVDFRLVARMVWNAWSATTTGAAFCARLARDGLQLLRGRRACVVADWGGNLHPLVRTLGRGARLLGRSLATAAQVASRLADLVLPRAETARRADSASPLRTTTTDGGLAAPERGVPVVRSNRGECASEQQPVAAQFADTPRQGDWRHLATAESRVGSSEFSPCVTPVPSRSDVELPVASGLLTLPAHGEVRRAVPITWLAGRGAVASGLTDADQPGELGPDRLGPPLVAAVRHCPGASKEGRAVPRLRGFLRRRRPTKNEPPGAVQSDILTGLRGGLDAIIDGHLLKRAASIIGHALSSCIPKFQARDNPITRDEVATAPIPLPTDEASLSIHAQRSGPAVADNPIKKRPACLTVTPLRIPLTMPVQKPNRNPATTRTLVRLPPPTNKTVQVTGSRPEEAPVLDFM